ncbi:PEP-CTERM sorting domain-containing protein [Massilia sp. UMI-21]|nr:PEP-CTERM sorting domain-containing protein [Massilia sp. UMI-21]
MRILTRAVLPVIASFAMLASSQAATIIDTGAGGTTSGYALASWQWLGNEFDLDKDYTITGINGWMSSWSGGAVQMNVTNIIAGKPGSALYSTSFTIGAQQGSAWVGASGLAWDLLAGTYAVTFTPTDSHFDAAMAFDAPSPSGQLHVGIGGDWYQVPGGLGLQVFGVAADAGEVPEPASLSLMAIALAGIAASRRKRA